MNLSLGTLVQSFFTDHLPVQKGLRLGSIRSYRDTIRLFLCFVFGQSRTPIAKLVPDDLTFDRVLGPGLHRWHPGMLDFAGDYGFQLRVCRPYRARTKGKVERFNGYLKGSFLVPLAATLRAGGLKLDVDTANREVLRWLNEVANTRIHATTGVQPCVRLAEDQAQLTALPIRASQSAPAISRGSVMPLESLQHPLSVYQALLEDAA